MKETQAPSSRNLKSPLSKSSQPGTGEKNLIQSKYLRKGVEIQPLDQHSVLISSFLSFICLYPASFRKRLGITCSKKRIDEDNKQTKKMTVEANKQTEPKGPLRQLVIKHKFGSEHPGSQGRKGERLRGKNDLSSVETAFPGCP